jgi:hypothetical protein
MLESLAGLISSIKKNVTSQLRSCTPDQISKGILEKELEAIIKRIDDQYAELKSLKEAVDQLSSNQKKNKVKMEI